MGAGAALAIPACGDTEECMKIAVTGAGGYLGRGVVKSLIDRGHEVVACGFHADGVDARAKTVACDLFSLDDPYEELGRPDVLLHMAWRDGFSHYSDAHIEDLPKHFGFIRKMADCGTKKVAVIGSMHEVGFFEGSINEATSCWPVTPYGISKNALRALVENLAKRQGFGFQWLRGYYIVGNDVNSASIFSKIAAAAARGQEMFPFTMGQNQYDFIDYPDFCLKVAEAVEQDDVMGVINICSGWPEKLADRVERFIEENGYAIKLEYGAFPDRPYDSKAVWGDSSKIDIIERLAAAEG